jgi:hypothetical protein
VRLPSISIAHCLAFPRFKFFKCLKKETPKPNRKDTITTNKHDKTRPNQDKGDEKEPGREHDKDLRKQTRGRANNTRNETTPEIKQNLPFWLIFWRDLVAILVHQLKIIIGGCNCQEYKVATVISSSTGGEGNVTIVVMATGAKKINDSHQAYTYRRSAHRC